MIERAAQEIAVELGFCDRDEWGTDECDTHDRDRALRAAGAALDAANYQGAVTRIAALERELGYAIDALEGKPWTGWSTGTARDTLQGAMRERMDHAEEVARVAARQAIELDQENERLIATNRGAVTALQGIRSVLADRDTDPDAAGVAYDAAGHALAALGES